MSKQVSTECYIWCESKALTMHHSTWGRDASKLMKWIYEEVDVKADRVYPAEACAIIVMATPEDRVKVLELTSEFLSYPITFRSMTDEEYLSTRRNVRRPGDKWSWRVKFDDKEPEPFRGVANSQMRHPRTGHIMCIACMHPLDSDDFNVCKICSSGEVRDMWMGPNKLKSSLSK